MFDTLKQLTFTIPFYHTAISRNSIKQIITWTIWSNIRTLFERIKIIRVITFVESCLTKNPGRLLFTGEFLIFLTQDNLVFIVVGCLLIEESFSDDCRRIAAFQSDQNDGIVAEVIFGFQHAQNCANGEKTKESTLSDDNFFCWWCFDYQKMACQRLAFISTVRRKPEQTEAKKISKHKWIGQTEFSLSDWIQSAGKISVKSTVILYYTVRTSTYWYR